MSDSETTDVTLYPASPSTLTDRLAREIAANLAATIEMHHPALATDRFLLHIRGWARAEVNRWFGEPKIAAGDMDERLRASGAHRRHIKRLRTLAGTVQPGDPIDPVLAVMDASDRQEALDRRAGGPVIDGDATDGE